MAVEDIWVFAYGSLIWDPGFAPLKAEPGLLFGYHRALCVYSCFNWGTHERPGLVVGLLPGGSCRGRAFRVASTRAQGVLDYLDGREGGAYRRKRVAVALAGRVVAAHTFVVDRDHPRYAGRLAPDDCVGFIRQGVGTSGSSREYLENTVRHLDALGISDGRLHALLELVERESGA